MSIDPAAIPASPAESAPATSARESLETLTLLSQRRSTKIAEFTEPGPSDAQIDALIALAARTPDHGKLAPWRFVIIAGEARTRAGEALAETIEEVGDSSRQDFARAHFLRAPACVMVVSTAQPHAKIPEWEQTLSSAGVCYAMLIAAHAMGFAGAWLTEWPTYDEKARASLGLAEHERIAGFIFLGTARGPVIERTRPNLAERVTRY
jgi:nitroreductase